MFVPMRPCAALAAAGRAIRAGASGRLQRTRGHPAGPPAAEGAPLTPTLSPQGEGAGRSRGGRRAIRAGGVGAEPPQKENPRAGGWAERPCEVSLASTTRPCARSSGMGAWGAQPPADEGEGQTVRWFRPRGGAAPPRLSRARGGVGAEPPTERKSEGGWVGQSGPARYPSRPRHDRARAPPGGGVGGCAPHRRGRERGRTGRSALGAQAGRSFRSSEHQQGSGFRTKRGPPHGGPHAWAAKRRNAQGVRTGSCSSSAGGSGSGALAIFSAVTSPST